MALHRLSRRSTSMGQAGPHPPAVWSFVGCSIGADCRTTCHKHSWRRRSAAPSAAPPIASSTSGAAAFAAAASSVIAPVRCRHLPPSATRTIARMRCGGGRSSSRPLAEATGVSCFRLRAVSPNAARLKVRWMWWPLRNLCSLAVTEAMDQGSMRKEGGA